MANLLSQAWRAMWRPNRNGHAAPPPSPEPSVRTAYSVLEEAELHALLREIHESWGDEIDARERLHDVPGFSTSIDKVVFSESELADIRHSARLLCQADQTACGIVEKLSNYVVRTGFTYVVEGEEDANLPAGLVQAVQAVLDGCRDLNDFDNDLDREIFSVSHVDGDLPIVLYADEFGQTRIRTLDADQIASPETRQDDGRDHSYGVTTAARDVEAVFGYWVKWPDGWEWIAAERVEHIKLNVRRRVKRGLSDFYAASGPLQDASKLLRNMSRGAQVQAAIAFIREHPPGTSQGGIQSMVAGLATHERTGSYATGTRTEYGQLFRPGKIVDVVGTKYYPGPMGQSNAPIFVQVLQADWRAAAQRWSMPEYLVSSDASNANFSSTLVAGDPFVIYCEQQQAYFGRRFLRIFWKALHTAWLAGRFAQFGNVAWSDIQRIIDVQATPPDVSIRDREQETNRRGVLYQNRVISLKQWRQEEGYDPERMEQQVKEEPAPVSVAVPGLPSVSAIPSQVPAVPETKPTKTPLPVEQDVQVSTELVLNGAQIAAALQIVLSTARGEIPRDTGLGQLKVLFNLTDEQALQIMGSAGTDTPTTPNPTPGKREESPVSESSYVDRLSRASKLLWEGFP